MKIQTVRPLTKTSLSSASKGAAEADSDSDWGSAVVDTFKAAGDIAGSVVVRAVVYPLYVPVALCKGLGSAALGGLEGLLSERYDSDLLNAAMAIPTAVAFAGIHGATSAWAVMQGAEGFIQFMDKLSP